ncbi:MAG: FecR domain-containing protein [Cytophagales bacterium]|nr:FecR domain-containing protein [Cytophagales bacterium]
MTAPPTKQQLLQKFLSDGCTREELETLLAHLRQDPEEEYAEVMQQVWRQLYTYPPVQKADADRMFGAILRKTGGQAAEPLAAKTRTLGWPGWSRVAAACAGVLLLAGLLYRLLLADPSVTHQTAYGQMLTVTLPDQSVVRLNGNSVLRYPADWADTGPREVWLDGEAFFSVVHTRTHRPFVVHATQRARVEVLGTEFTVADRQEGTRVVLNSGSVRLTRAGDGPPEQILMKPGELVEWKNEAARVTHKRVNPRVYSSWTEKKLLFDDTPLREVVTMLRNTYGLEVEVSDSTLLDRQLSGAAPIQNVDVFLSGLARTFDLQITKTQNRVEIRSPGT